MYKYEDAGTTVNSESAVLILLISLLPQNSLGQVGDSPYVLPPLALACLFIALFDDEGRLRCGLAPVP